MAIAMKLLVSAVVLSLCIVTRVFAADPSMEDQIRSFQKVVTAAVSKRPSSRPGPAGAGTELAAAANSMCAQLLLEWQSNSNLAEFERNVAQLVAFTNNDPDVLKAANDLLTSLRKNHQSDLDRQNTVLDALLKQAGDACVVAKAPEDLDDTLKRLAPYGHDNYGSSPQRFTDQASAQRASQAYRFVALWQDYLAVLPLKNSARIVNLRSQLLNMVDPALMPRSRILALQGDPDEYPDSGGASYPLVPRGGGGGVGGGRAAPRPASTPSANSVDLVAAATAKAIATVNGTIENMVGPDDLAPGLALVASLDGANPRAQLEVVFSALSALAEAYREVHTGDLPMNFFRNNSFGNYQSSLRRMSAAAAENLERIRWQILLKGAALVFADTKLAPQKDEGFESYLERIMGASIRTEDWQQVRRALEVYRDAMTPSSGEVTPPQWLSGDLEAFGILIVARNQETAGQFDQAVAGYERVLRVTGKHIPVQVVGQRLDAIKKIHPEAFAEAERILNPGGPSRPARPAGAAGPPQ